MGKVINLNDFNKYNNGKLIATDNNKNSNSSITITKDEIIKFEKDIFFDDDDFISRFYLKEM